MISFSADNPETSLSKTSSTGLEVLTFSTVVSSISLTGDSTPASLLNFSETTFKVSSCLASLET